MKVSELNFLIKNHVESIEELKNVIVEGEIANKKEYPTAIYFSIIETKEKNIKSSIRAIYWKKNFFTNFENIDSDDIKKIVKDGNKICANGKIEVYQVRGDYSIIVHKIKLAGEGERLLSLEKLKIKLKNEGFFEHKRKINQYPNSIGIITGKGSAAYKDIVFNINRRYPITNIYFFPTIVQGEKAVNSLINSLKKAYKYNLDTIIIGRGGGSNEDLNVFNDENVAKIAFESPFPIISAVGHEINKSIIDFVADKYASTPTGAAEIAVKDKEDILKFLNNKKKEINTFFLNKIESLKEKIKIYENYFSKKNIKNIFNNELQRINLYKEKINNIIKIFFTEKENILELNKERLLNLNLSVEKILKKGFAINKNKDNKIIKESSNTNIGDILEINFYKSKIKVQIIEKGVKNE